MTFYLDVAKRGAYLRHGANLVVQRLYHAIVPARDLNGRLLQEIIEIAQNHAFRADAGRSERNNFTG